MAFFSKEAFVKTGFRRMRRVKGDCIYLRSKLERRKQGWQAETELRKQTDSYKESGEGAFRPRWFKVNNLLGSCCRLIKRQWNDWRKNSGAMDSQEVENRKLFQDEWINWKKKKVMREVSEMCHGYFSEVEKQVWWELSLRGQDCRGWACASDSQDVVKSPGDRGKCS